VPVRQYATNDSLVRSRVPSSGSRADRLEIIIGRIVLTNAKQSPIKLFSEKDAVHILVHDQ
jgi:hypothetical protein